MIVTIYTLPDCPICHMIKTKLEQNHIPFVEKDFVLVTEQLHTDRAPVMTVQKDYNDSIQIFTSPKQMTEWINKWE